MANGTANALEVLSLLFKGLETIADSSTPPPSVDIRDSDFEQSEISAQMSVGPCSVGVGTDLKQLSPTRVEAQIGPLAVERSQDTLTKKTMLEFDWMLCRASGGIYSMYSTDADGKLLSRPLDDDLLTTVLHRGGRVLLFSADSWQFHEPESGLIRVVNSKGFGPVKVVRTQELLGKAMETTTRQVFICAKFSFNAGAAGFQVSGQLDISARLGLAGSYNMDGKHKEIANEVAPAGCQGTYRRRGSSLNRTN